MNGNDVLVEITASREKNEIVYRVESASNITNEEFEYYLSEIVSGICKWKKGICEENIRSFKGKISKMGVNCYVLAGDLRLDKTIEELYKIAVEKDVSVLINNAGTASKQEDARSDLKLSLNEIDDKQIDEILITNLVAPIKLTKRLYTLFLDKGYGTIININSLSGLEAQELRSAYCASKWGLRGFTDSFRLEAEKHKVRVLGVYPSRIKTKAYFTFGMKPQKVAQKIYAAYSNTNINEIKLDGRPKK